MLKKVLLAEESVLAKDGTSACLRKCGLIDIGYDGAQVWQHKQHGVGFLVMRLWDVPLEVRGKEKFTHLLSLIPGPKEPNSHMLQNIFMVPLISELKSIARNGIEVYDPYLDICCASVRVAHQE